MFRNGPFTTPIGGVCLIVDEWMRRRDEFGSYTFEWRPLTVAADIAVVVGGDALPIRADPQHAGSHDSG